MSDAPPGPIGSGLPEGWIWVELHDPRLEGWEASSPFCTPAGSRVAVSRIEAFETEGVFDPEEVRAVFTEITSNGGEVRSRPWPLFYRRRRAPDLSQLSGALDYVRAIVHGDDIDEEWTTLFRLGLSEPEDVTEAVFQDSEGPPLTPSELEAAALLDSNLRHFPARLAPLGDDAAEMMRRIGVGFRAAYRLGRAVRSAELAMRYGEATARGLAVPEQGRAGGRVRGEQLAEQAQARHGSTIPWVQSLVDEWQVQDGPLTFEALASLIHDRWAARPTPEGPIEPPALFYLAKKLLPSWRKEGLLRWPRPPGAH